MTVFHPYYERVINTGLFLSFLVGAAGLAVGAATGQLAPAGVGVCVAGYLFVRTFMWKIVVSPTEVVVHGLWRTRRIQRIAVVAITDWPAVRWRNVSGGMRVTPLALLVSTGHGGQEAHQHDAAVVAELRRQLGL